MRDEEPFLIELLLGARSAIDAAIFCVVLLGIAVAFLVLGHTAGRLVAGGLIVLWLCTFGAYIWRKSRELHRRW